MSISTEIATMDDATMLAALHARFADSESDNNNTTSNSLGRLRITRDNVEDMSGDIISPAGSFCLYINGDNIYARTIKFRYYDHRWRYKRYDPGADRKNKDGSVSKGSYIHSVLVESERDEAPSEDGSFQCGRPSEYIHDWNSLSKDRQEFIRSCRLMTIFYGEVSIVGVNQDGEEVDKVQIPVEFELSSKTSGKSLRRFYHDMSSRRGLSPNGSDVTLKPKKISGGVTYYDLDVSLLDDPAYKIDDHSKEAYTRFVDHIVQINKWVMDKHNGNLAPSGVYKDVSGDVSASFVDVS